MNPTDKTCPTDIARQIITDYRPSRQVYTGIADNNTYRLGLQKNAEKLMKQNRTNFASELKCGAKPVATTVLPFSLDSFYQTLQ